MSDQFIPFALPDIGEREIEAVVKTMRSGWLTTGPNTQAFEEEFAKFIGGDGIHAVAVNSATAGLHLALEALSIGPGDEVLVPNWTFTATAEVVRYLGATPVLVEVDNDSLNIDFNSASSKITTRTKAIMPVHFAGLAVDREALARFAETYSLSVVEDAAHALPAYSKNVMVGNGNSAATVFSFYATKTMTTGEGGMVVTRDGAMAQRMRVMRLHGINRDAFDRYRSKIPSWYYEVVAPGFKYNMTDTASAIGRVQLERAQEMRDRRCQIAEYYFREFADLPIQLPAQAPDAGEHSWHLYTIRLRTDKYSRNDFIAKLFENGVGASVHFIPLHRHPYWNALGQHKDSDFPVSSKAFEDVLSLPIFSSMDGGQIEKVAKTVKDVLS